MLLTAATLNSTPVAGSVQGIIKTSLIFSAVGMSIVFSGLLFLLFSMKLLNLFLGQDSSKKSDSSSDKSDSNSDKSKNVNNTKTDNIPDDVKQEELNAACLGISLYMYKKKYDEARQFILTGKSKERPNKPWALVGKLAETSRDIKRFDAVLRPSTVKYSPNNGQGK